MFFLKKQITLKGKVHEKKIIKRFLDHSFHLNETSWPLTGESVVKDRHPFCTKIRNKIFSVTLLNLFRWSSSRLKMSSWLPWLDVSRHVKNGCSLLFVKHSFWFEDINRTELLSLLVCRRWATLLLHEILRENLEEKTKEEEALSCLQAIFFGSLVFLFLFLSWCQRRDLWCLHCLLLSSL